MPSTPSPRLLRLYGQIADHPSPHWAWAERQLRDAGTYWVVPLTPPEVHPHPRPVWGVWHDALLHLSIGSPMIRRALEVDPTVTVHLGSGTDVVLVEGTAAVRATGGEVLRSYDGKYDWHYDVGQYGDLTVVTPSRVLAWRSGGRYGRDGFRETGAWDFGTSART